MVPIAIRIFFFYFFCDPDRDPVSTVYGDVFRRLMNRKKKKTRRTIRSVRTDVCRRARRVFAPTRRRGRDVSKTKQKQKKNKSLKIKRQTRHHRRYFGCIFALNGRIGKLKKKTNLANTTTARATYGHYSEGYHVRVVVVVRGPRRTPPHNITRKL